LTCALILTNNSIVVGQLLSNAAIKGFGERTDRWAYRGPFLIQLLFIVIIAVGLPFAPESPWYFVRKNRTEDAKRSLQSLYGPGVEIDSKLAVLVKTVTEDLELTSSAKWIHCFQGMIHYLLAQFYLLKISQVPTSFELLSLAEFSPASI
jgi:hypothetical protein